MLCDVSITVSYPIVLVKSSATGFCYDEESVFPGGCVSEGHGWDGAPWDQLLVN